MMGYYKNLKIDIFEISIKNKNKILTCRNGPIRHFAIASFKLWG